MSTLQREQKHNLADSLQSETCFALRGFSPLPSTILQESHTYHVVRCSRVVWFVTFPNCCWWQCSVVKWISNELRLPNSWAHKHATSRPLTDPLGGVTNREPVILWFADLRSGGMMIRIHPIPSHRPCESWWDVPSPKTLIQSTRRKEKPLLPPNSIHVIKTSGNLYCLGRGRRLGCYSILNLEPSSRNVDDVAVEHGPGMEPTRPISNISLHHGMYVYYKSWPVISLPDK